MSGKLYSLNTRCFASVLTAVSKNYAEHHNKLAAQGAGDHDGRYHTLLLKHPLQPFDQTRALAFTHALVKTVVTSFLAYEATDSQVDIIAELLFGTPVSLSKEVRYFVDDFLGVDEVDNIYTDIDHQVSTILKRSTWNIVDIFDMSHSISIVVQEDLRIREWKQMKGFYKGGYAPSIDLDLSEMFAFLRMRTNQKLNPVVVHRNVPDPSGEPGKELTMEYKIPVGDRIDFKSIVLELLTVRYGYLHTEGTWQNTGEKQGIGCPRNYELLIASGLAGDGSPVPLSDKSDAILTVSNFLNNLVAPVINSYALHHYIKRLDDTQRFTVAINSDEHLVVTMDEEIIVKVDHTQRLRELADSYLRGDYLPPKEREEAERYIQENQL